MYQSVDLKESSSTKELQARPEQCNMGVGGLQHSSRAVALRVSHPPKHCQDIRVMIITADHMPTQLLLHPVHAAGHNRWWRWSAAGEAACV
jgi:hypothetical protein